MDIREEWKCDEHDDQCYQKDGQHFPLNRWKLKAWAAAVVLSLRFIYTFPFSLRILYQAAGKTTPREPPSNLFLGEDARRTVQTKSRGRIGNSRSNDANNDTAQLLMAALVTALTQRQGDNHPPVTPTRKRTRDESLTPSNHTSSRSHVAPPSSPAPAVEDELRLCLDAFGSAKSVSTDLVDAAFDGLNSKGYTPDVLEVISVNHLAELTGFSEGRAAALMKFAREWSSKMDQKRARVV
jgi:hypothetical protein